MRVTTRGLGAKFLTTGSQWVFGGGAPSAAAILQPFFSKKYVFLGIFWHKFLLKNSFFKCLNKVCWCASKPCARGECLRTCFR